MQEGDPAEENLKAWGHHRVLSTVPDPVMQCMSPAIVSFVFSCQARPYRPLTEACFNHLASCSIHPDTRPCPQTILIHLIALETSVYTPMC